MPYCQLHGKKSSNDKKNTTSCEKIRGSTRKKLKNQPTSFNTEPHCTTKASNDCDESLEDCSQNLKSKHVSLNLHESIKSKPCQMHNKSKNCTAYDNYLLNFKQCVCSTNKDDCFTDSKCCTTSMENNEKVAELKDSVSHHLNHCQNNTAIAEELVQSKSSIPHTDCKYCHNNSEKIIKSKRSTPHTICKYPRNKMNSGERVVKSKNLLPHTDCKYCLNNINIKKVAKPKSPLPHTECKYCLNNTNNDEELTSTESSSTSTDSISLEEELSDELLNLYLMNGNAHVQCSLHDPDHVIDPLHLHNRCYPVHHSPASYPCTLCEHPEFCLVNNGITSNTHEHVIGRCSQSLQELNIKNSMYNSIKLKSCEFCLRSGETPVIYNSHQFQNASGTITCPILKQHICHDCGIIGDIQSCPSNYDEIIAAINATHVHNSIPNVGIPFTKTANDCVSCSLLSLQSISSSNGYLPESSLEMPLLCSFQKKSNPQDNKGLCRNSSADCYLTEEHHNSNSVSDFCKSSSTRNQFDTYNVFLKRNQNNAFKLHRRNNSANAQKPKTSVSCQYCLTTGKPPYIYNSHELRDGTGSNIKCPILKEHVNVATGGIAHTCNGCTNNTFEEEIRFPLLKSISNGSLSKRQYLDLIECLM